MAKTKKEFSKEAMYKKIMPSMFRANDDSQKTENKNNTSPNLSNLFVRTENIYVMDNEEDNDDINDGYEIEEIKNDDAIEEVQDIQDIQEKEEKEEKEENNDSKEEHSRDKIDDLDYKYTVNFIEVLIKDKLDAVLEKFKCCQCESCLTDIMDIALNSFPSYSFTGTKKEIEKAFIEFKQSSNIDVISAIIKAIIIIRKKEKHNKN